MWKNVVRMERQLTSEIPAACDCDKLEVLFALVSTTFLTA
jgi:hypothetical protein